MNQRAQAGFSLVETMFAIGVLCVAALGMAGVFAQGMAKTASSPGEVLATQKAAAAIESVFSARDSHTITVGAAAEHQQRRHLQSGPAAADDRRPRWRHRHG